ncbi:MAG: cob(I)yrinic acid a,c-diamide adenosyltransferase [Flavobacteriales bacterium]|nr:cob(I)yrinic acid a,c-diamide adenosyltransferase [Flavobacteriales bacterium]MCX7768148.1 cob(I)yrinic acid a,c-diamide adenosyltransferase [Flavobacteriales bacterium]MDW8409560.1 cob(I)yrinic acid a,c-diamide adenosyltransferase [Flavobacteriales bacterium]
MKVYTRKGDKGTTQLFGGARVPKHHVRIEAYGTVDELNSFIGWLRDQINDESVREELLIIQNELFVAGSILASQPGKNKLQVPTLEKNSVTRLEQAIDAMDAHLEPLRYFILPGGHPAVSAAHLCRTICRRAERCVTSLGETEPDTVPPVILEYLNRLSDYFFVLARHLARLLSVPEIPWIPQKK